MDAADVALVTAAAFATSVLSAVVGMAGGILLLAVLLLFLDPLAAIPLHGAIQLLSNGTRTAVQWRHVHWGVLRRFGLLLVPGGLLGLAVAQRLPADAARVAIGVFVLLATWLPLAWRPAAADDAPPAARSFRRFVWLGGAAGAANVTLGAVGPLLAPFFLELGLTRQALVGTKAACQSAGHAVKIALFGAAGFAFAAHASLLVAAGLAVLAGTWVGSRLLDALDERAFTALYRAVLTLVALRLAATGLA